MPRYYYQSPSPVTDSTTSNTSGSVNDYLEYQQYVQRVARDYGRMYSGRNTTQNRPRGGLDAVLDEVGMFQSVEVDNEEESGTQVMSIKDEKRQGSEQDRLNLLSLRFAEKAARRGDKISAIFYYTKAQSQGLISSRSIPEAFRNSRIMRRKGDNQNMSRFRRPWRVRRDSLSPHGGFMVETAGGEIVGYALTHEVARDLAEQA